MDSKHCFVFFIKSFSSPVGIEPWSLFKNRDIETNGIYKISYLKLIMKIEYNNQIEWIRYILINKLQKKWFKIKLNYLNFKIILFYSLNSIDGISNIIYYSKLQSS